MPVKCPQYLTIFKNVIPKHLIFEYFPKVSPEIKQHTLAFLPYSYAQHSISKYFFTSHY